MKIVVTGAVGFIGRALVPRLEKDYGRVITCDRDGASVCGDAAHESVWKQITAQLGDDACIVIHMAALPDDAGMQANMRAAELAAALVRNRPQRSLIYTSSALVYGNDVPGIVDETRLPAPVTPYARHKHEIEQALRHLCAKECVIMRLSNVYGAESKENTVAGRIIRQLRSGSAVSLMEYVSIRDFVHVDDVVHAISIVIRRVMASKGCGQTVNVSTGVGTSIYDFVQYFARAAGRLDVIPPREYIGGLAHAPRLVVSCEKLRGWAADVAGSWMPVLPDEGAKKVMAWQ